MRRFKMHLPTAVKFSCDDTNHTEIRTETQNISARGVYFYLDQAVEEGTRLEMIMTFPTHITLTGPMRVRLTGRVVRVGPSLPGERVGMAAAIEEYEFVRSTRAAVG